MEQNTCMFIVWDKLEESEKPAQATLGLTTAGFLLQFLIEHI